MLALCSSDGTRTVDRAVRVLSLCRSMGVDPNRRSLLIIIEGLARDGQVEPAYQFHKELVSREWNPDQKPYGKLVAALCIAGQVRAAFAYLFSLPLRSKLLWTRVLYISVKSAISLQTAALKGGGNDRKRLTFCGNFELDDNGESIIILCKN